MIPRLDEDTQALIQEFFKKGGEVTICPPGQRTEGLEFNHSFYRGRRAKSTNTGEE